MSEMISFSNGFEAVTNDKNKAADLANRAEMMLVIRKIIEKENWTQAEAARVLETTQPRINDLLRGKIHKFSFGALMDFLRKLGFSFQYAYEGNNRENPLKVEVEMVKKCP